MYKRLHWQLTFLFTGIAGVILIAMSISFLYMSEKEMTQNLSLTFSSKINSMISNLEQQNTLSWEWMIKTSTDQNFLLAFYDNGIPIAYNRTVLPKESLALTDAAMAYALNHYPPLKNSTEYAATHREFSWVYSENETYLASIINIHKNSGELTGIVLFSKQAFEDQIYRQRLHFFVLNAVGILVLLLFSYFFTGKLLAPIIEARQKQAAFVSAASHELRTPIAVLCSCVSAAKLADNAQKEHFLQIMEEESLLLSTLADDLLLLNRADSGRLILDLMPTELDTLLLNACEAFEPMAKEHNIRLIAELPKEAVRRCNCDAKRITQTLGILISNALSYGKAGGYVKLSLSCAKTLFWIMVEDNGPGIAEKDKPYIFDRFYRADESRYGKEHFGLGLCIAKEIVTAHKGNLTVTDTPGGGARFFILLRG